MSTASDIVSNIRSLAQRNGEIDKRLYSELLAVEAIATEATEISNTAHDAVIDMSDKITTASTTADNALSLANDAGAIVSTRNTYLVSYPIVVGDLAIIGGTSTYSLYAESGLSGNTISSFSASITGQAAQTVTASNNSGTVSFTTNSSVASGTILTISVTATDNEGNISDIATKSVTAVLAYVSQPTITSPAGNTNVIKQSGFTATSNNFNTIGASDTHSKTSWKICHDRYGTDIALQALNTNDLLIHSFTADNLKNLAVGTYYLFVQHIGTSLGASNWSNPTTIIIKNNS